MATLTDLTTSTQTVTATGAVTPTAGVSISGTSGDWTVCVEVISLTSGKTARIQIEDSTNAFTAVNALATVNVIGTIDGRYSKKFSFKKEDYPNNLFGTAAAVARVNVVAIDGSASLTLHAWLET